LKALCKVERKCPNSSTVHMPRRMFHSMICRGCPLRIAINKSTIGNVHTKRGGPTRPAPGDGHGPNPTNDIRRALFRPRAIGMFGTGLIQMFQI
jgi:hypothetical protein